MTPELVSVVLPVYNGARFLEETIQSVQAQSYRPIEVIVVDDGSSDDSATIAEGAGVRVIRQENRGLSGARNAGIRAAGGGLVALIDDDDRWLPEKLAIQVAALRAEPDAEICTCRFSYFLTPGIEAPELLEAGALGTPQPRTCPSAWLLRPSVFERAGMFDETFRVAEDIEWLSRARDAGARTVALDACLVEKRIHDSNISGQFQKNKELALAALRASIERKRGGGRPS